MNKKLTALAMLYCLTSASALAMMKPKYNLKSTYSENTTRAPASASYVDRLFEARVTSESKYVDQFHFYLVIHVNSSSKLIQGMYINENYNYSEYHPNAGLDPSSSKYNSSYFSLANFYDGVSLLDLPSFIPLKDPIVIQVDKDFNASTGGKVYIYFLHTYKLLGSDYRTLTLDIAKVNSTFKAKCILPNKLTPAFNAVDITIGTNAISVPTGVKKLALKQDKISIGTVDIERLPKADN